MRVSPLENKGSSRLDKAPSKADLIEKLIGSETKAELLMFFHENPPRERVDRVTLQHRNGRLQNDRSSIDLRIHHMNGRPGDPNARRRRAGAGRCAGYQGGLSGAPRPGPAGLGSL